MTSPEEIEEIEKKIRSLDVPDLFQPKADKSGYWITFVNESDLKTKFDHSDLDANIVECGVFVCEGVDFCKDGLKKYIDAGLTLDTEGQDPSHLNEAKNVGFLIQCLLRQCGKKGFAVKLKKCEDFRIMIMCKKCLRKVSVRYPESKADSWKELKLNLFTRYDATFH